MLQVSVLGPWAMVALSGEFDIVNSDGIRLAVDDLVDQGVTDVTVDLSSATFIGAATLNALVAANNRLSSVGGRLMTVGLLGLAARIFDATDLAVTLSAFAAPLGMAPVTDSPGTDSPVNDSPVNDSPRHGDTDAASGAALADDIARNFFQLSLVLLREPTVTGDLDRIVRTATSAIPECVAASISLIVEGQPRSAIVTSRIAIEVDLAQYRFDEGPCVDATRHARRVRVDVLETEERFVHFAPLALKSGIHATLSAPIMVRRHVVGSINLYSAIPGAFDQAAETVADLLAGQAAIALVKSDAYRATEVLVEAAQRHADDRSDVAVADGMLSALHHCSIEMAHELLRRAADANDELLIDAAKRVLANVRPPD